MRWSSLPRFASLSLLVLAGAAAGDAPPEPAVSRLAELATAGDAGAQTRLGMRYRDGQGVARDYAEALRWTRLAADQGEPAALDNVGFHYFRGLGVPQSYDIALGYFKAAAAAGSDWGMFNLGQCHFSGLGGEQNFARAVEWWTRAAEKGHEPAALQLAMMYAAGEGVGRDEAAAARWCERAAGRGSVPALVLLGELHFTAGRRPEAQKAWEDAARRGSPEAADLLKLMPWRTREPEPGRFAFVQSPHVHQGHNNCGATSAAMFARSQGAGATQYDVKRLCPGSPIGTGTDWAELVAAGKKLGLGWELVTFAPDEEGFAQGAKLLRAQLDAKRPVVIDFTVPTGDVPGGEAGHTLLAVGYVADEDLFVLRDPARHSPGLRLMPAAELARFWRSRGYSAAAEGLARPAIIVAPR